MVPLLENPNREWKAAAFSQYPRGGAMGYTLRTKRWRYTEWIEKRGAGDVVARELYDQSGGEAPSANLAGLTEHAATVRELSALLDRGLGWRRVRERVRV
jgi:iduronate 2-sulfatase